MRHMILTLAVLSLLVGAALAACPEVGTYSTSNGVLAGRTSEAWCTGVPGMPGDTQNAMSWDGTTLGTQWHVWGAQLDENGKVLTDDQVDQDGNGYRTFEADYDGGQFWLAGDGPWGDGTGDLSGQVVGKTHVTATVSYMNWQPVGAVVNVYGTGVFDDCTGDCIVDYSLTNLSLVWRSDSGLPMPADYPPFLCGTGQDGDLYDACCGQFHISCTVADEKTSWGTVKQGYR